MNKGLSELLKKSFLIPVERPKILNGLVPDPHWLAGGGGSQQEMGAT